MPYQLDEKTGEIDYDQMEKSAQLFRPKLIVAGASAYARLIDYERIRAIADSVGAWVLADMAHISGLVSAQVIPTPFDFADVVTTTTHKSLRGPRGAMIFYRKGVRSVDKKGKEHMYDIDEKVREDYRHGKSLCDACLDSLHCTSNLRSSRFAPSQLNFAVFPGLQGGPHNHTITALATCLKQAKEPSFVEYQKQVLKNSATFADKLMDMGYELVSGGTSNHLVLVDLKTSRQIDGARVERILEMACMSTNKNTIPGDTSALTPGGIRMGAPALTSRGLAEADFVKVAEFFDRGVAIAKAVKATDEGKKLKGFREACATKGINVHPDLAKLRDDVQAFANSFPTVGFDEDEMESQGPYENIVAA